MSYSRDAEAILVDVSRILFDNTHEDHEDHDLFLMCHNELAQIYGSQKRWEEKQELEAQVVDKLVSKHGEQDPNTLNAMHNLAQTYEALGQDLEAHRMFTRVVENRREVLGLRNARTLTSMGYLANINRRLDMPMDAVELQEIILTSEDVLGRDHPEIIRCKSDVAVWYGEEGRLDDALPLQRDALASYRRCYGNAHENTMKCLHNLAILLKRLNNEEEATATLDECIVLRQRHLGYGNSETLKSMQLMKQWSHPTLNPDLWGVFAKVQATLDASREPTSSLLDRHRSSSGDRQTDVEEAPLLEPFELEENCRGSGELSEYPAMEDENDALSDVGEAPTPDPFELEEHMLQS